MKVTGEELANLNRILDDLWNSKVTPESFHQWHIDNSAVILDAFCTVRYMIRKLQPLEVEL
jgi:hypothetical protein